MVSRRNYFSITVIMLVILFLFQFSSAAVDLWSEHDVNPHLQQELPGREDAYQMEQGGLQETAAEGPLRKQVAYIGGAESPVEKIVYYWSLYTKRNFRSFSSLQESEAALEDG